MSDYLPGFLERITAWVNAETSHKTATAIAVTTDTNDWVGSTMDGWTSEMWLTVRLDDGQLATVAPDEQESLWRYVMGFDTKENQPPLGSLSDGKWGAGDGYIVGDFSGTGSGEIRIKGTSRTNGDQS